MDSTRPPQAAPLSRIASMAATAPGTAIDELLAHASWARALARRLVNDEQRADDVVQEAWLAAVEKPPRPGPGLRAWFSRLIRNLAHNQRRADLRRDHHERQAAAPEPSPPANAAIAEEFAAQRLLADALLRVNEPYRETLLRRWYHDEKPAAIARAMAVPVKTVETRLARGLERLREELTRVRAEGGEPIDWRAALLPLARWSGVGEGVGAGATAAAGALIASGAAVMTTAKLAVAVVAIVAIGAAGWIGLRSNDGPGAKGPVRGESAPAVAASAAEIAPAAATRDVVRAEAGSAPTPTADPAPSKDPLGPWRKHGRLHGRVLASDTRKPIAGASVRVMIPKFAFGPDLDQVTTDANGEFVLERLSDEIRLIVRADGHLGLDRFLEGKQLTGPAGAAATEFLLEPRSYATLVCRLVPEGDLPISPQVLRDATVIVSPRRLDPDSVERFQEWWTEDSLHVPFERKSEGVFRCERVPARMDLRTSVKLGPTVFTGADVEPLQPGETREVVVPIAAGIVVTVRFVDATTRASLPSLQDQYFSDVQLAWTGAPDDAPFERIGYAKHFEGPTSLPGPGHLALDVRVRGFEHATIAADVRDGDVVEIPLVALRRVELTVADAGGGPVFLSSWAELEETATTKLRGGGSFGLVLETQVVNAGAALPDRIESARYHDRDAARDLDCNRAVMKTEKAEDKVHVWKAGSFELYLPREPRLVGVYADGLLAGRVEVSADDAKLTVPLAIPERPRGALSFRAVEAATGRPVERYDVELLRFAGPSSEAQLDRTQLEVHDPKDGLFFRDLLPVGRYEVSVVWTPVRLQRTPLARWSGTVDVTANGTADLGVVELAGVGALEVRVADERGVPVADAELSFFDAEDDSPVVALVKRQEPDSIRTNRNGVVRAINLLEGIVRIEARAAGFEVGTEEIEVEPGPLKSCTVVLRAAAGR